MKKNKKRRRKLSPGVKMLIFLGMILIVFAIPNLTWLLFAKLPYDHYRKGMEAAEMARIPRYETEKDGYLYSVTPPEYLVQYTGYLSVQKSERIKVQIDENGELVSDDSVIHITLFIWPKFFGEPEYGVAVIDSTGMLDAEIMIDENMNYIPAETVSSEIEAQDKQLLSEHYDEIEELLNRAASYWNF